MNLKNIVSWNKNIKAGPFTFNFNIFIILLLIFVSVVNFYNITSIGTSFWDEGDYLYAAARVVEHGDIVYLGAGLKPLYVLFISISMLLFGAFDFAGIFVSGFFSILLVYLVYLITIKLFNKNIALFAALSLSVNGLFVHFSKVVYSDIVVAFFVTLTLYYYLSTFESNSKFHSFVTGFLISVCFVTKNIGALTLILIWIFEFVNLFYSKKRDYKSSIFRLLIISFVALAIIFFISYLYQILAPSNLTAVTHQKSFGRIYDIIFRMLESPDFFYYPLMFWHLASPLLFVALIFGLGRCLKTHTKSDILILLWFFFYYIFFSLFYQHRMKLFVAFLPVISIIIGKGIYFAKLRKLSLILISTLFIFGFVWSLPIISYNFPLFHTTSDTLINLDANGVLSTNSGVYKFYLKDLPLKTIPLDGNDPYNHLQESYDKGYTHLIIDWRVSRLNDTFGETILNNYQPILSSKDNTIISHPEMVVFRYMNYPADYDWGMWRSHFVNGEIFVFEIDDLLEVDR